MRKISSDNNQDIRDFVYDLSLVCESDDVENPYINPLKSANLIQYLIDMRVLKPEIILIGEAPGYLGAQQTGIPFTSENIMLKNPKYAKATSGAVYCEKTASCIWNVVKRLGIKPLFWNIFPFHPYKIGEKNSNRTPTDRELVIGKLYLLEFLKLFPTLKHILAVGRKSEEILKSFPMFSGYIRHPSYAGERLFEDQLTSFYATIKK